MPYFIGGGILYLVLIVTIGVMCIRKGHWVMFIVGLFFPLFWLIGAIMPPVRARVSGGRDLRDNAARKSRSVRQSTRIRRRDGGSGPGRRM